MAPWLNAQVVPAADGLGYGLLLFLVAGGLTLAYGVGDTLNLAHGTVCALGAYTAAVLSHGTWTSLALALVAGLAVGATAGGVLAALLAPLAGRDALDQALLTVGVALIGGDLLTTVTGGRALPVTVPAMVAGTTTVAGHRYPLYRLLLIPVAAALAIGGHLALRRTRAGRVVRATVAAPDLVACLGISPARRDRRTDHRRGAGNGRVGAAAVGGHRGRRRARLHPGRPCRRDRRRRGPDPRRQCAP